MKLISVTACRNCPFARKKWFIGGEIYACRAFAYKWNRDNNFPAQTLENWKDNILDVTKSYLDGEMSEKCPLPEDIAVLCG